MPSQPWFRLYRSIIAHPKVRSLTPEQRWVWVAVLCLADDGWLRLSKDRPLPLDLLADQAGVTPEVAANSLVSFTELGMISRSTGRQVRVTNWHQYQYDYPSDRPQRVKDRVRRFRETRTPLVSSACETSRSDTELEQIQKPPVVPRPDGDDLNEEWLRELGTLYPEVNLDREVAKALEWQAAQAPHRKKKSIRRFVRSWVDRAAKALSDPLPSPLPLENSREGRGREERGAGRGPSQAALRCKHDTANTLPCPHGPAPAVDDCDRCEVAPRGSTPWFVQQRAAAAEIETKGVAP